MTDEETKARIAASLEKAKDAIVAMQAATDGLADIVRLVVRRKPDLFYFGVPVGEKAGHYWSMPDDRGGTASMRSADGPVRHIDGVYAPVTGHRDQAAQGLARTVLVDGCTVVQWWDSSADKRGGCSSSLVARGTHSYEEMMDAAREQFPLVLARCEAAGFKVRSE